MQQDLVSRRYGHESLPAAVALTLSVELELVRLELVVLELVVLELVVHGSSPLSSQTTPPALMIGEVQQQPVSNRVPRVTEYV